MVSRTLKSVLLLTILIISATTIGLIYLNYVNEPKTSLNFYVLGDSQGYNGGLTQVIASANAHQPDFIFHCGDLTPFGQENQYNAVLTTLESSTVPFYATVGNHDIRLGGNVRYEEAFGPSTYSFNLGPAHFSVVNTSSGTIPQEELAWLEEDLSQSQSEWKVVFTHIPPFDPREGENHSMVDEVAANQLMNLLQTSEVDAFFAGHIHMFNLTTLDGVLYAISGGAGASLYADEESGGFYHYLNVTINQEGLFVEPILLNPPTPDRVSLTIQSKDASVTLSIQDLENLDFLEQFTSFQNQFDNWGGQGVYQGVKISTLLELLDGINENQTLRVTATDGFSQDFAYSNVYPNASWYDLQGDMVLAFSFNESYVPYWEDGFRLVMMPEDGAYSNTDCATTSAPGMGYNLYPSAGARWIRYVVLIEVID
jgi:3',5'-cyclic AMP phosphodiesterase CpdA